MYKKSVTRIEKENESNQVELSNPALHDIIATNHIMLTKKPRDERFSRACKAVIIMIILGLIAVGVIVLTVVLAHSRNSLMTIVSRSVDTNLLGTSNNTRLLFMNQENLTTMTNEQTENENWQTTTIHLTSNNLPTLTTQNLHISSLIMRTKQPNEHTSSKTQSMKSYPSLNTIVNQESTVVTTIQTTVSNQATTFAPSSHPTTTLMTTENVLKTTMESQDDIQTSANNPHTSIVDNTLTLIHKNTTLMPGETSFTIFISRHFNIQSTTVTPNEKKRKNELTTSRNSKTNAKYKEEEEDDMIDDLLFL